MLTYHKVVFELSPSSDQIINIINCSVGPTGVCWGVDKSDGVWRRLGAKVSMIIIVVKMVVVALMVMLLVMIREA